MCIYVFIFVYESLITYTIEEIKMNYYFIGVIVFPSKWNYRHKGNSTVGNTASNDCWENKEMRVCVWQEALESLWRNRSGDCLAGNGLAAPQSIIRKCQCLLYSFLCSLSFSSSETLLAGSRDWLARSNRDTKEGFFICLNWFLHF